MNIKVHLLFLLVIFTAFFFAPVTIVAQEGAGIVAAGATVTKVQSGFIFTEGPAADSNGNVYFTDVRAERIYLWSCTDGSISVYREKTGWGNGLMFDQNAHLAVCEMGGRRVILDNMEGRITVLADSYKGKKLNSPNDLWIDPMGGIYFSDPRYGGRMDDVEKGSMQVYYISPDHKKLKRVTHDLVKPNGLIGTQDGKILYIADAGDNKTWLYKIESDGTLSEKELFCPQGSDGMTRDERNNVYVTGRSSISVYNAKGQKIEEIMFPERPANMTFAGKERKTLFVTARTSVYTITMTVRGAPTPLDQTR